MKVSSSDRGKYPSLQLNKSLLESESFQELKKAQEKSYMTVLDAHVERGKIPVATT